MKYNNRDIKSWSDITVGEYLQIQKTIHTQDDDITKFAKIAGMLFGVDLENMPIQEATNIIQELSATITKQIVPTKDLKQVKVGDTIYKVTIPDAMTFAQFQDYTTMVGTETEERILDLLAIVLVPKGKLYNNGYDLDDAKSDIAKIAVTDVYNLMSDFQKRSKKSQIHSLCSLTAQTLMAKMPWEKKKQILKMELILLKNPQII